MAHQINRFVVIPNANTPFHISNIRIFNDFDQATSHAHLIRGTVRSCLDTDALDAFQKGEEEFGAGLGWWLYRSI